MGNLEKNLEYYLSIDALHIGALKDCFKGIPITGWSQSGPEFTAHVPTENFHFVNTDYYYKGELEFFHLTRIENLTSILNARAFRLYNLHSSKDPLEYAYAANFLGLPDAVINNRKEYTYTLSFCPITELRNRTIWETYGENSAGAAIVFTIENDPSKWVNFHLTEVKYEEPSGFQAYRDRVRAIEAQHKGISLHCDLSRLIGFHKAGNWMAEKEVRIATYFPYGDLEEYWKYAKPEWRLEKGRNRITNYIELPIWVDNDSSLIKSYGKPELDRTRVLPGDYFDTRPKIKIKNVLIGPNSGIEVDEFQRFHSMMVDIIRYNYGYDADLDDNLFEI
jgi:hypothetical protein